MPSCTNRSDESAGIPRSRRIAFMAILAVAASVATAAAAADETALRRAVAWQIALDRVGFSPGLIDGRIGAKTELATREFQRVRRLPITGRLDDATARALGVDPDNAFGWYVITPADLAEIGPLPASWVARSRLSRLGHASLETVLAEKFHCATHLLNTLNPGRNINALKPGDRVAVPNVVESSLAVPTAASIEINLQQKVIRVLDDQGRLAALFHCSVAADKAKMPSGNAQVTVVVRDPDYMFDPKKWPEVREPVPGRLRIPPGPRNPVGRVWMQLSLPGYGIHGTPNPELIGKTGSHGCFRLANWDAVRLSRMVRPGIPVRFVDHPLLQVASTAR